MENTYIDVPLFTTFNEIYELAVRMTIDEVFERTMQRGDNISDVLHEILRKR